MRQSSHARPPSAWYSGPNQGSGISLRRFTCSRLFQQNVQSGVAVPAFSSLWGSFRSGARLYFHCVSGQTRAPTALFAFFAQCGVAQNNAEQLILRRRVADLDSNDDFAFIAALRAGVTLDFTIWAQTSLISFSSFYKCASRDARVVIAMPDPGLSVNV